MNNANPLPRVNVNPITNASGTTSYRVTMTFKGERRRQACKTEAEALTIRQNWEREAAELEPLPAITTRLTNEQAKEAESCFQRLSNSKLPLTLSAALEYAIANYRASEKQIKIADAVLLFLADKKAANCRPAHTNSLKSRLNLLNTAHGQRLANEITPELISPLIFRAESGPLNRVSDYRAFTNFFNWLVAGDYCSASPMAKIQAIELDDTEPVVMPLDRVRRLLIAALEFKEGALVPYVVLALFCAIRPAELRRLAALGKAAWDVINLDNGVVTIGGKIAKTRSRRPVEMALPDTDQKKKKKKQSANVAEWLLSHKLNRTPIVGPNWRKNFDAVKELAGYGGRTDEDNKHLDPWPQDILRHTGISHHFSHYQHDGKTARWAGNSPDIIHKHYKGLVTSEEARAFWSLTPDNVRAEIVQLKQPNKAASAKLAIAAEA